MGKHTRGILEHTQGRQQDELEGPAAGPLRPFVNLKSAAQQEEDAAGCGRRDGGSNYCDSGVDRAAVGVGRGFINARRD